MAEQDTSDTTATPAGESGGRLPSSQADLDRVIGERLARQDRQHKADLAEMQAKITALASTPQATPAEDPGKKNKRELVDDVNDLRRENRFNDVLAEKSVSKEQRQILKRLLGAERPEGDLAEWMDQALKLMPPSAAHSSNAPTNHSAVVPPNAPAPGPDPSSTTDNDNPLLWSKEQLDRILNDKGVRDGLKYIRQKGEAYLSKTRIVPNR